MAYTLFNTILDTFSGDWGKFNNYEETIIKNALANGDLFNVTNYLWFHPLVNAEKGNFIYTELAILKLYEIAENYNYNYALINAINLKTELFLKKHQYNEALIESERGLSFSSKYSTEIQQLYDLANKAAAQMKLNDTDGAKNSIQQGQKIIDKNKSIPSSFLSPFLITKFSMDIDFLKILINSKNKKHIFKLREKTKKSGELAIKKIKKNPINRPKAFRLMGEYFWLIGKQQKALKWWNKSIKDANKLGSKLHLSRTYFEVGKSLMEPNSKYKELNDINAEEYLEKARKMFKEMDLQWDLDELDKVMAASV